MKRSDIKTKIQTVRQSNYLRAVKQRDRQWDIDRQIDKMTGKQTHRHRNVKQIGRKIDRQTVKARHIDIKN